MKRVRSILCILLSSLTLSLTGTAIGQFSPGLTPYPNIVPPGLSTATIIARISNQNVNLTTAERLAQQAIVEMYVSVGIDPSYDYANDISTALLAMAPTGNAKGKLNLSDLALSFSPDAPYYQPINPSAPRVLLPAGFFQSFQLNSVNGPKGDTDGIGYGEVTTVAGAPILAITSEWYSDRSTMTTSMFPMPVNWFKSLPELVVGDSHMIFVDPASLTFVSTYKTTLNKKTGGPKALYASNPTTMTGMGDRGGSTASRFAELPVMIQPGELTAETPIQHAVGGPIQRVSGARVYPAYARDAGMLTSDNTCTGTGYMDTGIVPYGGVIQLDPSLNLANMGLSRPALRVLQAMQTYGYYVMDFGCTDMDIYTAINSSEIEAYGGMYGNAHGIGVQNEVANVLRKANYYVVAPQVKH
jgi:hypothetical protein